MTNEQLLWAAWAKNHGSSGSATWGNITGNMSDQDDLNNALNDKIKLLGNVDDPTDPGYGYAYHFPYDATFTPSADKITIGLKTITLDNNKYKMTFDKDLPAATETSIGLMKASDAKAVRTDLPTAIAAKQDKLTAGDNIAITDNVISVILQSVQLEGTTGTLTDEQATALINNAFSYIMIGEKRFNYYTTTFGSKTGFISTYVSLTKDSSDKIQIIHNDKTWTLTSDMIYHLPTYTAADKGKVLKINNEGVPEWTEA